MKIKHIFYVLLVVFSLGPLYLFGAFMIYEHNQKVEDIMRENLAAISGVQILNIMNFCESRKESLEMVAQYNIVRDSVRASLAGETQETQLEYLENLLMERRKHNVFLESISVMDREFRVVASSEPYERYERSELANVKEKYLTGEFYIGDVYQRKTANGLQNVVAAYQGIFFDGALIGYMVEEINTSHFDEYRVNTNLWDGGTLYIIDGRGAIITAGTQDETRKDYVTNEEERNSFRKAWDAVDHKAHPSGEISYKYRGVEYITYYSDIDYTSWGIRITVNLGAHLENARAYGWLIILTAVCLSSLLAGVGYLLSKRLTQPLAHIEETLKKVQEEQDYTLRIDRKNKDELGALSGEINELLSYIEQENIQEKEQQRHLQRKAERDPLTGVKNKKAIESGIQDMVQQAAENKSDIVVGFLDIDDFKDYNTRYGHQEGDRVIQFVASVLKEAVDGAVGRTGGDEFVFCMMGGKHAEEAEQIADAILKRLNEGLLAHKKGVYMPVPCSIGLVCQSGGSANYSALIRDADEAMYRAKENGKNTYYIKNKMK